MMTYKCYTLLLIVLFAVTYVEGQAKKCNIDTDCPVNNVCLPFCIDGSCAENVKICYAKNTNDICNRLQKCELSQCDKCCKELDPANFDNRCDDATVDFFGTGSSTYCSCNKKCTGGGYCKIGDNYFGRCDTDTGKCVIPQPGETCALERDDPSKFKFGCCPTCTKGHNGECICNSSSSGCTNDAYCRNNDPNTPYCCGTGGKCVAFPRDC